MKAITSVPLLPKGSRCLPLPSMCGPHKATGRLRAGSDSHPGTWVWQSHSEALLTSLLGRPVLCFPASLIFSVAVTSGSSILELAPLSSHSGKGASPHLPRPRPVANAVYSENYDGPRAFRMPCAEARVCFRYPSVLRLGSLPFSDEPFRCFVRRDPWVGVREVS